MLYNWNVYIPDGRNLTMIMDVTGVPLTPGNGGRNCLGSGMQDAECCCDECDYHLCCIGDGYPKLCADCTDTRCPRRETAAP